MALSQDDLIDAWNDKTFRVLGGYSVSHPCGDKVGIVLELDEQSLIKNARWFGAGCAQTLGFAEIVCREIRGMNPRRAVEHAELLRPTFDGVRKGCIDVVIKALNEATSNKT